MATTIDVVVDELCSNTVAKIPSIIPATGLFTMEFEENASPKTDEKADTKSHQK